MKTTLETKYDFKKIEENRYQWWIEKEFFKAGRRPDLKPFTIVIPPPNVTGKLHLGHAWDNTLQDIIIRRKRMQGFDALYLPGMDHAGIATQAKVDERLKQMGTSHHDIGREKFLDHAWKWKEEYALHIRKQWEALGISVDYSRERFTLDQTLNDAVNKVFITLYEKGLLYRGNRIINWDSEAQTALSNIEVEYRETEGNLYYFRYPLEDLSNYIVVATTRPETMFADQAVMVHPDDERYKVFEGKKVFIPGTKILIPVITDDYVDMTFGTGAVKVTPAHDPNDFEIGVRHGLLMPLCMNEDGTMNHMAHEYQGLDRFACRRALIKDLEALNLVEKIDQYTHSVGYSERTGVIVEPRLSLQWFVAMEKLAAKTINESKINYYPQRFKKLFDNWMHNIQDWCVSRQLWWGHRIPAWYKNGEIKVQVESPGVLWQQDEDVLDTWFSSALWPFSTLGWPNDSDDLKRYYPTDVLVTGYDILTFWVSRMVFQGLEFTGEDPFKDVLLHGLIRDAEGRKMSKSLGNGVDPMDVIDKYGVDTLRYFLTTNSAPGMDLRYDEDKVESSWNFINKLWNITRFIQLNLDELNDTLDQSKFNLFDSWIVSRLNQVIKETDYYFDKYEFVEASRILYQFVWNEFANWYLELSKVSLQNNTSKITTQHVLLYVIKVILKLLHPYMPFVTEELFLQLSDEQTITLSKWPTAGDISESDIDTFKHLEDLITKVRNLRAEYQIIPSKPLDVKLVVTNKEMLKVLHTYQNYVTKFINTKSFEILEETPRGESVLISGTLIDIYVLKSDLIDQKALKEQLLKQKAQLELEIQRSKSLLENANFIAKAPEAKKTLEISKYQDYLNQYQKVLEELKQYV